MPAQQQAYSHKRGIMFQLLGAKRNNFVPLPPRTLPPRLRQYAGTLCASGR